MNKIQQKWLLIVLVVIALNAGIWYLGITPARTLLATTEAQVSAQVQKEAQLRQRLESLQEIDVAVLEQEMEELTDLIPEAGLLREVLNELDAAAEEMEVELSSISVGAPTAEGEYQKVILALVMTGDYDGLYSYINYLETHSRLILINSFSLTGQGDGLSSNLQLSLFAGDFDTYTPHEAPGKDNPFEGD